MMMTDMLEEDKLRYCAETWVWTGHVRAFSDIHLACIKGPFTNELTTQQLHGHDYS